MGQKGALAKIRTSEVWLDRTTNYIRSLAVMSVEMTLEECQKVLEEKRKALEALKTEERKVEVDKELASMQQLSNKKTNDDIFVKLGSEKDKRKEIAEREERAKKNKLQQHKQVLDKPNKKKKEKKSKVGQKINI